MNIDARTREALNRWQECKLLSQSARFVGLDASPEHVNKYYRRYRAWYEGRLATGYLINVTGVKPTKKG